MIPIAAPARDERPVPDLARYDVLLDGGTEASR